jgi:hypothetical protein
MVLLGCVIGFRQGGFNAENGSRWITGLGLGNGFRLTRKRQPALDRARVKWEVGAREV